jgi:hypothetical protein
MKKNKFLIVVCFVCFTIISVQAQENIVASGNSANDAGGSISYSVGQLVYTAIESVDGQVSQGVIQPYEISQVTKINQIENIGITCNVFPNPTADLLVVEMLSNTNITNQYSIALYNAKGELLQIIQNVTNQTYVSMENYFQGIYFINLIQTGSDTNESIATYRVVKN